MRVRIITSYELLNKIRDTWRLKEHHPNSAYDFFTMVCKTSPEVCNPLVIVVGEESNEKCIVAGRLERSGLVRRIGYLRIEHPRLRMWRIVYKGFLGELDDKLTAAVVSKWREAIEGGLCDCIHIRALPANARAAWRGIKEWPYGSVWHMPALCNKHYRLRLDAEPGFLLKGMRSKHRTWIRGRERKLHEVYGNSVVWKWYTEEVSVKRLSEVLESVAARTYQRRLGAGFINNALWQRRLELYSSWRSLRAAVLEIQGSARAYWLGTLFKGTFFADATGYTPEMRPFEAGTLLFLRMLDWLAGEGIAWLDFGFGSAEYKARFATESWDECDVYLFGPALRSRMAHVLLLSVLGAEQVSRKITKVSGIEKAIKQRWRAMMRR